MKKCPYTSVDELPLIITADEVAAILGISRCQAYGLMRNPTFPSIPVGKRKIIPRDKFIEWMETQTVV